MIIIILQSLLMSDVNHDDNLDEKILTMIKFEGLAKSGAGFQRAEDSSAEHIAQVYNDHIDNDDVDDFIILLTSMLMMILTS